jgi:hypothetical protein
MMFITPMPPTTSEITAMAASRYVSVFCVHQERMEFGLHLPHVRARLHSHDEIIEETLSEDPCAGRCVGEPDGVVHVVSPRGQSLAAQYADDEEGCAADKHILAQRIRAVREQVLHDGLAEHHDLGIALHMIGREEHARLRRPVMHLRKVFAGPDRSDSQVLVPEAEKRRQVRLRNSQGDARHSAD